MKLLSFALISLISLGCARKETLESFPMLQVSDSEWSTYEGTIVTGKGAIYDVEISLKEAPVGVESYYQILATSADKRVGAGIVTKGKYFVTPGLPDSSFHIQLVVSQADKQLSELGYLALSSDLYFSTNGNNELVLTDDDFTPVTRDARYTIYKRSRLFTVEGYVTIQGGDSSEFFERNTHENWNVAPLAEYAQIKSDYLKIATERNEGVYVRALAYTISDTHVSDQRDKLVFKKVVKIGTNDR